MSDIQYIGEWLWAAYAGKGAVAAALALAVLGVAAGLRAYFYPDDRWARPILRAAVWGHFLSVAAIGAVLYVLILNHRFEFQYVWQHSSRALPLKYVISSLWEGQEGSFWLWTFWNSVLLLFLVRRNYAVTWGAAVVVFLGQVMFLSMLLGVKIGDITIGINPFLLLRETMAAPIFSRPDYVSLIQDGTGLNPLLQSYWMVIHPPVLFLGFASAGIPFALVAAMLMKKGVPHWLPWTQRWALVGGAFLGLGILLGALWAYEALNFGGYWAWDPVENSSLVPWLVLVAGIHMLLIYQARRAYLRLTLFFLMAVYWLLLYSTFLTRSGVLGNASVHSFTDMGLGGQLIFWLAFFVLLGTGLYVRRWKDLRGKDIQESLYSREFWMYIGALIVFLSSFHIIVVTSLPVINKVLGTHLAPPTDAIQHYNRVQLPFAVIILLLTAAGMFLEYRRTPSGVFLRRLGMTVLMGLLITITAEWAWQLNTWAYRLLSFAGWTAAIGNGWILWGYLRKKRFRLIGGALSHTGLAVMVLGVLVSSAKKEVISRNTAGVDFGDNFSVQSKLENVLIYRDSTALVGPYQVRFSGTRWEAPQTYYRVDFADTAGRESFTLYPSAQISKNMGLVASPDIQKWWDHDLYVHITAIPDTSDPAFHARILAADTLLMAPIDTFTWRHYQVRTEGLFQPEDESLSDTAIRTRLLMVLEDTLRQNRLMLAPEWHLQGRLVMTVPDMDSHQTVQAELLQILPEQQRLRVVLAALQPPSRPYIILKAIAFPFINLLWLGGVLMLLGFGAAAYGRKLPKGKAA